MFLHFRSPLPLRAIKVHLKVCTRLKAKLTKCGIKRYDAANSVHHQRVRQLTSGVRISLDGRFFYLLYARSGLCCLGHSKELSFWHCLEDCRPWLTKAKQRTVQGEELVQTEVLRRRCWVKCNPRIIECRLVCSWGLCGNSRRRSRRGCVNLGSKLGRVRSAGRRSLCTAGGGLLARAPRLWYATPAAIGVWSRRGGNGGRWARGVEEAAPGGREKRVGAPAGWGGHDEASEDRHAGHALGETAEDDDVHHRAEVVVSDKEGRCSQVAPEGKRRSADGCRVVQTWACSRSRSRPQVVCLPSSTTIVDHAASLGSNI
jgi:hypothetical protein